PGGDFRISNEIMDTPAEAKYGLTRPQLTEAVRKLLEMGVEEFGIHAFLASNTLTEQYYPALAKLLFSVVAELAEETGANFTFVNLSGGIGIPYRPEEKPVDIMVVGEGVRKAFEEVLTPVGLGHIAIFAELGRYMLGPYGHLIATAIREKRIHKHYIGLDACAANLMRPAMYGAYHHITVAGKEENPHDHKYDVTGGLCENNDKFAVDRMLPKIEIGDIVVIHDTGAHGFSMGYNYNGKLRSAEILLREDGSAQLIRRAETPQDYFATLNLPLKSGLA
ncbi:MAG: diaminopimelate decarboxylase, partial [Limnochordia bacterium]